MSVSVSSINILTWYRYSLLDLPDLRDPVSVRSTPVSEKMNGHIEPRTAWPCLLPCKKIGPRDKDGISYLPDAIQILILDSLHIKEAFKTSVLSKKWRHLCCSLNSLSFVQDDMGSTQSQMKDVIDHVLRNHKQPSIRLLRIALNTPVPHNQMDEWISFAVSHHVKSLLFWANADPKNRYTFPSITYNCASLEVLKLINMHINLPAETFFFPNLETIELHGCTFIDIVFSTCNYPKLGKLVIHHCKFYTLSISSSTLDYLKIYENVLFPEVNLLSIPNLSSIHYQEKDPPNICLQTLLSLQRAYFRIPTRHLQSWDLVGKMLKGFPSLRDLTVGAFYIECLRVNWGPLLLEYPVAPCFSSVKSLKLVYSGKRHVPVLKVLLRSYPNLVHLEMSCKVKSKFYWEETTDDDTNSARYWEEKEKETLPANLLNSLVTYTATYGGQEEESELELIKFVVENAMALQNLNISVGEKLERNERNLRKKLKISQTRWSQLNVVISSVS